MREESRDGFEFVSIVYPFNRRDAIKIVADCHSIDGYQKYIVEHGIDKAEIVMPDLNILKFCPGLKYLRICPSYNASINFDFSPLYDMKEVKLLNCQNRYGSREQYLSEIDYSRVHGIAYLCIGVNRSTLNYNKIKTLKSLSVSGFKGRNYDLTDLFCSEELDTLKMVQCGINSLNGIEISNKMQCLYLRYNRFLQDISALNRVRGTLKALRIENCPKIEDFSVLGELENLELLELSGSNVLPNLNFLRTMKNLKTFVFNVDVRDGDLAPCRNLSYVYSEKDRKHYNLRDRDLPKANYVRGNEDIEEWRRLE